MPTIYEVAALAGVSPATVSRVLNGVSVSPEKSRLVREAAERLSFTPNRTARSLRMQSSEVIALVIPDIENPFFTAMARGVEDVAQAAGFSVVLCNTDDDPDKEARYLGIIASENMAGIILATTGDQADLKRHTERGRPVVAVDRAPYGVDVDTVLVDNVGGGRSATTALYERGHSTVACITGPASVATARQRAAGWEDVVRARGGEPGPYLRYADFRVGGGRRAMSELLALPSPPDAVFVANNLMSVGALQVLVEAGRTPVGMGIASFGDLPFPVLAPIGISIVPLPARQLGETAARMLIARINGDDQPARTVVLSNEP